MARAASKPQLQPFTFDLLDKRALTMVLITPEDALTLLEDHNPHNRSVKEGGIKRWAKEMESGRWDPDASDLKVDYNGNLLDGQHRLLACIRSGKPFGTLLRTGLDPETQHRVDVGIKRNTADTFKLEGIPWATNTAAAILLRRRYEEGEAEGKKVSADLRFDMSADAALEYVKAHPMHEKMASTADQMYRIGPGVARTVYFAALPMFAEQDETDAQRFADAFIAGEWGGPGSAIQALVRYLSSARTPGIPGHRSRNVNERHLLALVKAWNAWRMMQDVDRIRVNDNDSLVPLV